MTRIERATATRALSLPRRPVIRLGGGPRSVGDAAASHEVIVETIAATTTDTGLTVHAELDRTTYPTSVKIPDQEMKDLENKRILTRHDFHGE